MPSQSLLFHINADNRQAIQSFNSLKHSVGGVAAGLAATFGVGLGAAGLISFGKKVIETGDNIDKMSKRFGVGAEWIQKFMVMSELSGVTIGEVDRALKGQAQSLVNAERGLETDARAFRDLGISAEELLKLKPEEAFDKIARKLAGVSNESRRAALAQDIWGKSGTALLPMVKDYIQLAGEAANAVIFSDKDVANAAMFKDEMTKLNTALMGIAVDSGFLAWIADVANRIRETVELLNRAPKAGETGTGKGAVAQEVFGGRIGAIGTGMLGPLVGPFGGMVSGAAGAIKGMGGRQLQMLGNLPEDTAAIAAGKARAAEARAAREPITELPVEDGAVVVKMRYLSGYNN